MISEIGKKSGLAPLETVSRQKRALRFLTGFTFIEIFFVVIILGVITAVSIPRLSSTLKKFQLNSSASELQALMNYLRERSIVEAQVITLTIDKENKLCFARIKGESKNLKNLSLPDELVIEGGKNQINFFPDGSIDKFTLKLKINDEQAALTTEGVYGKVKFVK